MSIGANGSEADRLAVFRPVRMRSATDVVLAVLVDALRGGLYASGDLLPKERDLAERLGISRPILRQAFAVLRAAGVISSRRGPGGGTFVESLENLPSVLTHIQGEARVELRSILEVRRATDTYAALLCSERASDEGFALLRQLVEEYPRQVESDHAAIETARDVDVRFHFAVADLSENEMLAAVVRDTYNRLAVLRDPYPYGHVDFEAAVANQWDLFSALASRERVSVLAAVDRHLAAFERVMLGYAL